MKPRLSYQNVLVTGGAGFIGSHLVDALVDAGCSVTVLDNLATGHLANLKHLAASIRFCAGDIRDLDLLDRLTRQVDAVFHLAAVVSVTRTVAAPVPSTLVNDVGTLNVLEAARLNNAGRVVLASSSAVYGDDPSLPKTESMPARPLSPYALQKYTNERYAALYGRLYGLPTAALRFFNVYGPRQDPSSPYSGVISIFMSRAVENKAPVIYGDGQQTRDFVFVLDVVQALLQAAEYADVKSSVFNIGTGRRITVNAIWQTIGRLAGCSQPPVYADARIGDIVHSVADISLARQAIGFEPAFDLDAGLEKTVAWYTADR